MSNQHEATVPVDLFDHEFIFSLLVEMGFPPNRAAQLKHLYAHRSMYMTVGDCFGMPWEECNGLGQGCSQSVLAANAYVSTLFRHLDAISLSQLHNDIQKVHTIEFQLISKRNRVVKR